MINFIENWVKVLESLGNLIENFKDLLLNLVVFFIENYLITISIVILFYVYNNYKHKKTEKCYKEWLNFMKNENYFFAVINFKKYIKLSNDVDRDVYYLLWYCYQNEWNYIDSLKNYIEYSGVWFNQKFDKNKLKESTILFSESIIKNENLKTILSNKEKNT